MLGPPTHLGGPAFGKPRMFSSFANQAAPTPPSEGTVPQFTFLASGRQYIFPAGGSGVIPYFVKQPSETYPVAFSYAGQLPGGVSISSCTLSAVNQSTGADATSSVLVSPVAAIDDVNVVARVQSGVAGIDYNLNFLVYLSDSSVLEDNMVMRVASY